MFRESPRQRRWPVVSMALVLLAAYLQSPAHAVPPGGMTAAALNQAFRSYGDSAGQWTGADSTASVALPDGRVIWLFSDTFLGTVNPDGSRPRNSPFINNSMVVQEGTALVSTRYGGTPQAPTSLIPAPDGEFYWVGDATVESGTVRAIYNRMRRTGQGVLDFALAGTALVTFALPELTVSSVTELPLGDRVAWGSAILTDGPYTYIYGSEFTSDGVRFAHLARTPAGGLTGSWSFWTSSGWSAQASRSARLLSGVGSAFAVERIGGKYVVATIESNLPFNAAAVAYTSNSPTGPFSGPTYLFTAPEPSSRRSVIVYDLRIHRELSTSGKLLVSYNVNALEPDVGYVDARLYRPRFVDVAWPVPRPDPNAVPSAPTGLTAVADANGGVGLSWQAPVGSGPTYQVYQRDVTGGQTHAVRVGSATAQMTAGVGFLKTGHRYEFRVTASNVVGEGAPSAAVSVLVTIARPTAPTGVMATAGTDGSITVSWSAVPNAWHHDVHFRDVTAGEAEYTHAAASQPTPGKAILAGLLQHHEYEMVVTATHGGGTSPHSAKVRATAFYRPPPAPTGLIATAQGDGTIKLSWTAPAEGLYYWVRQRDTTAGESDYTQYPYPTTETTLTASYLVHGHEYEYQVLANNQGGNSQPSNTAAATSHYPRPGAPAELTAVAGDSQVTLTWSASPTAGVWYLVYLRDKTAGDLEFTQLPYPVSTCCTVAVGYLVNGHAYEFKVAATAQGGLSPESNVAEAVPAAPPSVRGVRHDLSMPG